MEALIDLILHLDRHLDVLMADFGVWVYVVLFLVIFCETGLVVTPFLPGDSLLFAVGSVSALGMLDIRVLLPLLIVAAVLGDSTNYLAGRLIGPKVFSADGRFLKKKHMEVTRGYYERHGNKTVAFARFLPIVRTFAPFVAGIGGMPYGRFIFYSVFGGALWVTTFLVAGFCLGKIPFIRDNFSIAISAIILGAVLLGALAYLRNRNHHH
jgi:membrane-associated protein